MQTKEYGNWGEDFAVKYLKKQGYKILDRNYTDKEGEMDIVAIETKMARKKSGDYNKMSKLIKNEDILCFIEVKSRNATDYGMPFEAVDYNKQQKYYLLSSRYIKRKSLHDYQIRYDIIEVFGKKEINHIHNAF